MEDVDVELLISLLTDIIKAAQAHVSGKDKMRYIYFNTRNKQKQKLQHISFKLKHLDFVVIVGVIPSYLFFKYKKQETF